MIYLYLALGLVPNVYRVFVKAQAQKHNFVANAELTFQVCEGLTNQRIALIQGFLIAHITNRSVAPPKLLSSFDSQEAKLPFREVYDVGYLRKELKGIVSIVSPKSELGLGLVSNKSTESQSLLSHNMEYLPHIWIELSSRLANDTVMTLGCTFNAINTRGQLNEMKLLWKIDKALKLNKEISKQVTKIVEFLKPSYTALHYRAEEDWFKHCKVWEGNGYGHNCLANSDLLPNVFLLEGVPTSHPVYIAGGYSNKFIEDHPVFQNISQKYRIISKDDILSDLDVQKNLGANRELLAAIDYAVCSKAGLFIGNSVSTFSAMVELTRSQVSQPSFHYNGGNIPLVAYMPSPEFDLIPKRLKWVFTMHLSPRTTTQYMDLVRVAVKSAFKHTLLQPVAIVYATANGDTSSSSYFKNTLLPFIKSLETMGVIVIRHTPTWVKKLNAHSGLGFASDHTEYFSRTNASACLSLGKACVDDIISTLLRVEIPMVGIIDDHVLYSDVDVMFLKNIALEDFKVLPQYFTRLDHDIGLMNVENMRVSYNSFIKLVIKDSTHLVTTDLDATYELFYRSRSNSNGGSRRPIGGIELEAFFVWHPYERVIFNKETVLVHWDGPKPHDYLKYFQSKGRYDNIPLSRSKHLKDCDIKDSGDDCWQWNNVWMSYLDTGSQIYI